MRIFYCFVYLSWLFGSLLASTSQQLCTQLAFCLHASRSATTLSEQEIIYTQVVLILERATQSVGHVYCLVMDDAMSAYRVVGDRAVIEKLVVQAGLARTPVTFWWTLAAVLIACLMHGESYQGGQYESIITTALFVLTEGKRIVQCKAPIQIGRRVWQICKRSGIFLGIVLLLLWWLWKAWKGDFAGWWSRNKEEQNFVLSQAQIRPPKETSKESHSSSQRCWLPLEKEAHCSLPSDKKEKQANGNCSVHVAPHDDLPPLPGLRPRVFALLKAMHEHKDDMQTYATLGKTLTDMLRSGADAYASLQQAKLAAAQRGLLFKNDANQKQADNVVAVPVAPKSKGGQQEPVTIRKKLLQGHTEQLHPLLRIALEAVGKTLFERALDWMLQRLTATEEVEEREPDWIAALTVKKELMYGKVL